MTGIYKIESPSGKIYIGSSVNIYHRIKYYKSKNCKGQRKLFNSIEKYGWGNHKFEILEECTVDKLYERERYYGDKYDVLGDNGLNLILPKIGEVKVGISEETRNKMSESKKGEKNKFYGKNHTEESKEKMRQFRLGTNLNEETKLKVKLNSSKHLSKIVLDLSTGVFFDSCKEASIAYGINHSTLKSRLNGNNKNKTNLIYV